MTNKGKYTIKKFFSSELLYAG